MDSNCMCQEAGLLVFPCSGGSDVGGLADKVGRAIAKCGKAKMFCLAGIGAHIPGMIESAKAATRIVAIDGCPAMCAKKTLEHAGLKVEPYNLKSFGFEKGRTDVTEENIKKAASLIAGGKSEKTDIGTSGCCTR